MPHKPIVTHKIDDALPTEVLTALAASLGFQINFEHSPGVDEWELSGDLGLTRVQHVGTRRSVCAFLIGYSSMRLQTTQILNDLDRANQKLILDMRARLGG